MLLIVYTLHIAKYHLLQKSFFFLSYRVSETKEKPIIFHFCMMLLSHHFPSRHETSQSAAVPEAKTRWSGSSNGSLMSTQRMCWNKGDRILQLPDYDITVWGHICLYSFLRMVSSHHPQLLSVLYDFYQCYTTGPMENLSPLHRSQGDEINSQHWIKPKIKHKILIASTLCNACSPWGMCTL